MGCVDGAARERDRALGRGGGRGRSGRCAGRRSAAGPAGAGWVAAARRSSCRSDGRGLCGRGGAEDVGGLAPTGARAGATGAGWADGGGAEDDGGLAPTGARAGATCAGCADGGGADDAGGRADAAGVVGRAAAAGGVGERVMPGQAAAAASAGALRGIRCAWSWSLGRSRRRGGRREPRATGTRRRSWRGGRGGGDAGRAPRRREAGCGGHTGGPGGAGVRGTPEEETGRAGVDGGAAGTLVGLIERGHAACVPVGI